MFLEPGGDIAGLDVVCGGGDDGDLLGGLFVCVLDEAGLAFGLQVMDEGLFYGMEEVETGKDELLSSGPELSFENVLARRSSSCGARILLACYRRDARMFS